MSRRPYLIVVTGPDGSGKSTACTAVRERLQARGLTCHEVSVWDALELTSDLPRPPFGSKNEAERYLADLDGPSRALFIFHSLSRAVQLGRRAATDVLLLNGYWYKYAVSELGYGTSPELVMALGGSFPEPDQVFFLDLDPATAWRRRLTATTYEQGPGAREASVGERFVAFQTRLAAEWSALEKTARERWIHVPATLAPGEVADTISGRITR